jgi:hypothetical protein
MASQGPLVVRHAPIFGFCRPLEVDGGVANARQGRHPGCASRLALASGRLDIIRESEHVRPLAVLADAPLNESALFLVPSV